MPRKRPLNHEKHSSAGGDKTMIFIGEVNDKIMAVYYKVYQDNNKRNPHAGSWYARAAMIDTDTTEDLAKAIMEKCTVNEADVLAVINALVGEITRSLQASHRVKLSGFGTFKIGLRAVPAETREKFSAANIKEVHLLFQPEVKISTSTGTRTRTFLTGTRVKELAPYDGDDNAKGGKKPDAGSGTGDAGSGNTGSGSDTGSGTGSDAGQGTGQGTGSGEGNDDL